MTAPYFKFNAKKDLYELNIEVNNLSPVENKFVNLLWLVIQNNSDHARMLSEIEIVKILVKSEIVMDRLSAKIIGSALFNACLKK